MNQYDKGYQAGYADGMSDIADIIRRGSNGAAVALQDIAEWLANNGCDKTIKVHASLLA